MLIGKDIRKAIAGRIILNGINLTIAPGKITALIGPSGSGKTTLLKTLSFLEQPDSGSISLDGATYSFPQGKHWHPQKVWPHVTVVFQQHFLWPHLTLRQNITLPLKLHPTRRELNLDKNVDELIDLLDLAPFIDRYPNQASLGQRQRVALARALVLDPAYILLDEVTASLDVEQVSVILSHLQKLKSRGIGMLIITHLIGFAARAADQVVFLDDGKVIEFGDAELLRSPKHERVARFLSVIESAM